jgi:predicted component of type VI protein secretion system
MPFLLERLSVCPPGADRQPEAFDETAAILAQIQRILAVRRHAGGFVAAVPWGLPSVVETGIGANVQLERYAEELSRAIAHHEPRLREVRVKVEPCDDPLTSHRLSISAVFPNEGQPRDVRVATPQ